MSNMTYQDEARSYCSPDDEWQGRYAAERRAGSAGPTLGLPLAGLVAVGLGALAWYYLGPDLRRYLKIRSM